MAVVGALICLGLTILEAAVRGGTCGSAEGGGSCAAGFWAYALPVSAFGLLVAAVVLAVSACGKK